MGKAERRQKRLAGGWQALERGDLRAAEETARTSAPGGAPDAEVARLLGASLFLQGRFPEAIAPLRKAYLETQERNLGCQLGHCYLAAGDPKNAQIILERVTGTFPDFGEALSLLGIALIQQGRHEEAVKIFTSALERSPRLPAAYNNLGNALLQTARHEEAIPLFEKAIALEPGSFQAHNNLGRAYKALRRYEASVECYKEALRLAPGNHEVHNNLGTALADLGRHEEAIDCYRAALAINPKHPLSHNNLGVALDILGRHAEAIESFRTALALEPDYIEAHANLGIAYQQLKRFEEAIGCYQKAIALAPDDAGAHTSLGLAFQELGRLDEAVACHLRALSINPGFAEAQVNLGMAYQKQRRLDEAVACYERAIALNPGHAKAHFNLGAACLEQKQFDRAIASCQKALSLDPDDVSAWHNLALAFDGLSRPEEAIRSFEKALSIRPDSPERYLELGIAYQKQLRLEEAVTCHRKAISLQPDFASAHLSLGQALLDLKRVEEAGACFEKVLAIEPDQKYALSAVVWTRAIVCDWRERAARVETLRALVREGRVVATPFPFLAACEDLGEQRLCAERYLADVLPEGLPTPYQGGKIRHEKIRVAYLSADFRDHPVAHCTQELFRLHDRSKFEVFGVSFGVDDGSEMRAKLETTFDRFLDVRRMSDSEVAGMIRDLGIDIAVDLMGFTTGCRLGILAHRPAPIQVNYLGYPGTSGSDFIDYILADRFIIPEEDRRHYSENVVYLPDSYMANHSLRVVAEPAPGRAALGLPEAAFVFCCFNNSYKITPDVFGAWMRLLQKIESSVLWLSSDDPVAERNLRREAAERGVDPGRLIFARRVKNIEEHYARYRRADLFLDTTYNGHVTASDALWAGLPVLTCAGRSFAGRVAGGMLNVLGLPELVTTNLADYEALALSLATDPPRLSRLREKLERTRESGVLFDADRFRRHIESAYSTMRETWQRGEPPRAFAVDLAI